MARDYTKRARLAFVEPMAATAVTELPTGAEWSYEIKFDGYRVMAIVDTAGARLLSRKNNDLTHDFPTIAAALARLEVRTVMLDGEVVAVDDQGVPRFQLLQHRSTTPRPAIVYYAFDLLHLNGRDLFEQPLTERRAQLATVLVGSDLRLSEPLPGDVSDIVAAARRLGLEGIVAKRLDSRYQPGERVRTWRKLRLTRSQEFVVGGYSPGNPFDALLVGYYDGETLLFAARVRAGFTPASRAHVFNAIRRDRRTTCPFANLPNARKRGGGWQEGVSADETAQMTWVQPRVVVQVSFVEWTTYGLLRHASFLGIREDKDPRHVRREG